MADRNPVHQPASGQGRLGSGTSIIRPNLLPYERHLLELAGLTEQEYRYFVQEVQRRAKLRPAEYAHIPDVQNTGAEIIAITSLVIGLASTALSFFLAPKPRAPQLSAQQGRGQAGSGGQLSLDSILGGQRFSPTYGFDSQAELANYGDPIPIIFGRWTGTTGGLLVTPKLVWSRMFSYGRQQGVKLLFVVGEQGVAEGIPPDGIDPPPDMPGIFLGNGSLSAIYDQTFAFYWKRNTTTSGFSRIQAANLVYGTRGTLASGDPESFDDIYSCPTRVSDNDTAFCAAHGLSNNAEFGCYGAIGNGAHYRVNWSVVSIPRDPDTDFIKLDPGLNSIYQRVKIAGQAGMSDALLRGDQDYGIIANDGMSGIGRNYSRRMGITALNGVGVSDEDGKAVRSVNVGDIIEFTIAHNTIPENYYKGTDREVSVQDINDAVTELRNNADDALQIGELFMIGRTTWQVIKRSRAIWKVEDKQDQIIELKCIDINPPAVNDIGLVSQHMLRADYVSDNNTPEKYNCGVAFWPLTRFAKATVRNTRPCEVTEIGIRSNVFQRLNGLCNFQTIMSPQQLNALDNARVTVQTGTVNSYIKRVSLFTIFLRPAGLDPSGNEFTWQPLGEQFCIIGSQPVDQYNFIRLVHPDTRQYEFQFIPKNGADVGRHSPDDAEFWHLHNGGSLDNAAERQILTASYSTAYGTFKVVSAGTTVTKLEIQQNSEFRNLATYQDRTVVNDRPTSVGIITLLPDEQGAETRLSFSEFLDWVTDPSFSYTEGRNGSFTWELTNRAGIASAANYPGNAGTQVTFDYQHNVSGGRWYKVRYTLTKVALDPAHFSGQGYVWVIEQENIVESSTNWDMLSEYVVSFTVQSGNPFRNPPASPTLNSIGQRRRVTGVISADVVQGRSQAWYEEMFGPARNYDIGTTRTFTLDTTNIRGDGIRLLLTSRVDYVEGHWSGQTRLWSAPTIAVSEDPNYVSSQWQLGDTFDYLRTVSGSNPFRRPGSQVGARFVIESRGLRITETYEYEGRTFEQQSMYGDLSLYGNLVEKSNANSPEHTVVYVNEIASNSQVPEYSNMTIAGLALKASRNFTALDQLRFWLKNGIPVKRFHPDESSEVKPSNLFCDLVYYLLTDRVAGVGDLLNMSVDNAPLINTDSFVTTARFLKSNGLYFDGAISSAVNVRQFIADIAPFMLCNFAVMDGRFALVPALPTTTSGNISADPVAIKQLFTAGNIYEDSFELTYISAEERKDFQAMLRFREERENQLPEERNIVMRWNDGTSTEDPLEQFDMTQYCTSRNHAELVGRFFMSIRRRITHTVSFKTAPFGIDLSPGDYIRVVTESNPYSSAQNGSISATGVITSATPFADGRYDVVYYKAGSEDVSEGVMTINNGIVQETALFGSVFTVSNSVTAQNVYMVEQLTLDGEGSVQITATEFPCDEQFRSLIAQDVTNAALFLVDS